MTEAKEIILRQISFSGVFSFTPRNTAKPMWVFMSAFFVVVVVESLVEPKQVAQSRSTKANRRTPTFFAPLVIFRTLRHNNLSFSKKASGGAAMNQEEARQWAYWQGRRFLAEAEDVWICLRKIVVTAYVNLCIQCAIFYGCDFKLATYLIWVKNIFQPCHRWQIEYY